MFPSRLYKHFLYSKSTCSHFLYACCRYQPSDLIVVCKLRGCVNFWAKFLATVIDRYMHIKVRNGQCIEMEKHWNWIQVVFPSYLNVSVYSYKDQKTKNKNICWESAPVGFKLFLLDKIITCAKKKNTCSSLALPNQTLIFYSPCVLTSRFLA